MSSNRIILNQDRNISLSTFLLPCGGEFRFNPTRPGILILPGGGYQMLSEREADPIAHAFNAKGFHAFVLRYSIQKDAVWPNPLNDFDQAMEYLLSHSDEWGLEKDHIATIGFSAGGHLAACAASSAKFRPAAAILGYPAIRVSGLKGVLRSAPDADLLVHDQTCPIFLFSSRNDAIVPIKGALDFLEKLEDHDISFESHIYGYGPHGFSLGTSEMMDRHDPSACDRLPQWFEDSFGWLDELFTGRAVKNTQKPATRDENDEYLSLDNSVGHLLALDESRCVLEEMIPAFADGTRKGLIPTMLSLRQLLTMGKIPPALIEKMEQKLVQIKNNKV